MEAKIITFLAVVIGVFIVYVICGTIAWCFARFEYKLLFKWMVVRIGYKKPKEIFYNCFGNLYIMNMKGLLDKYRSYHIPRFVENKWLVDMKNKYEEKILKSENEVDVIDGVRAYYDVTARLDGIVGMGFLKDYIVSQKDRFPTNIQRELMDVAVFMTIYMIRDDLATRKAHLLWALETLREMIHSHITFSEEVKEVYVIETENGKRYTKEWWQEGARLYSDEDEKDAIRYLINVCKGALGELMYYGSGFSNNDVGVQD